MAADDFITIQELKAARNDMRVMECAKASYEVYREACAKSLGRPTREWLTIVQSR